MNGLCKLFLHRFNVSTYQRTNVLRGIFVCAAYLRRVAPSLSVEGQVLNYYVIEKCMVIVESIQGRFRLLDTCELRSLQDPSESYERYRTDS